MALIIKRLLKECETGEQCDVEINVIWGEQRETLHAHSVILRGSGYFQAALRSQFQEGQSKSFTFEDIEPRVMKHTIRLLYWGEVPQDEAVELTLKDMPVLAALCARFVFPQEIKDSVLVQLKAKLMVSEVGSLRDLVDMMHETVAQHLTAESKTEIERKFVSLLQSADFTKDQCLSLLKGLGKTMPKKAEDYLMKAMFGKLVWGDTLPFLVHLAESGRHEQAADMLERLQIRDCCTECESMIHPHTGYRKRGLCSDNSHRKIVCEVATRVDTFLLSEMDQTKDAARSVSLQLVSKAAGLACDMLSDFESWYQDGLFTHLHQKKTLRETRDEAKRIEGVVHEYLENIRNMLEPAVSVLKRDLCLEAYKRKADDDTLHAPSEKRLKRVRRIPTASTEG